MSRPMQSQNKRYIWPGSCHLHTKPQTLRNENHAIMLKWPKWDGGVGGRGVAGVIGAQILGYVTRVEPPALF